MRRTAVICDRCGNAIEAGASGVGVELVAGEIRAKLPNEMLDLCGPCSERLLEWLRAGKTPAVGVK